jgi:hypothetical protein
MKGGNLMNALIHRDSDGLTAHAERIKQGLQRLEQDCSVWARKRQEKDLVDLMEDFKGVQNGVNLMLTDCICARSQHGAEAAKSVFDDLCEILCCLDPLFNVLKKARMQLDEAYIHPAILDRLEIEYGRFRKLIGTLQTHVNGQQSQSNVPLEETPLDLAQEYATTV